MRRARLYRKIRIRRRSLVWTRHPVLEIERYNERIFRTVSPLSRNRENAHLWAGSRVDNGGKRGHSRQRRPICRRRVRRVLHGNRESGCCGPHGPQLSGRGLNQGNRVRSPNGRRTRFVFWIRSFVPTPFDWLGLYNKPARQVLGWSNQVKSVARERTLFDADGLGDFPGYVEGAECWVAEHENEAIAAKEGGLGAIGALGEGAERGGIER